MELLNVNRENSTKTSAKEGFEGEPRILIAAIVEMTIFIVGSTGNLLACLAVMRNNRLQFATNFFIVSLAVADLLVCTILVPMRASQHFSFFLGKGNIHPLAAKVAGFLGRVNIVASICSLAALSIDRCIAIKYPMRYRFDIRYATWRVLGVIFTFWVFAIVFTSLPYVPGITDDVFLIGFIVFVLFVTVIIMLAYFRIFHVANKSRKRRKVGAIDIDLEENSPKHKNRKKYFHVHFSTNSCGQEVSSTRDSDNLTATQSSRPLTRTSAVRSFPRVPPIAKHNCSTQPQKCKPSKQLWEGLSKVPEVPLVENYTSSIHTQETANGYEHDTKNEENAPHVNAQKEKGMIKTAPLQLSRGRRHSAVLPIRNHKAYKKAQSAFTICRCNDIYETSSALLTQPADLNMAKTSQSTKEFNFPPCHPQGHLESSSRMKLVKSEHVAIVEETNNTFPYELVAKPSKMEQTNAHYKKTQESNYLQPEVQRHPQSSSKTEQLNVQIAKTEKSDSQKDSKTDSTKHFDSIITSSQEANSSLQGDLRKLEHGRTIVNLDKQLKQAQATHIKEDSVQDDLPTAQNLFSTQESEEQKRIKKDRHKDHKTTKTIGIVIGAFIALVYPRIIMILYHYGNNRTPASLLAKFWVRILLYSNSAVNPLLYAWRMREFRNEFSKIIFSLFQCGKIRSQVRIHPSQGITLQPTTVLSTVIATNN